MSSLVGLQRPWGLQGDARSGILGLLFGVISPGVLAAVALLAVLPTRAPAQVRGVTHDKVLIGMTAAFSGTFKENGHNMKVGIAIAFASANDNGGLHGRKLVLVGADHAQDPARAVPALKDLVERQGVFALIGNTGSSALEAQLPYFISQRVILFGPLPGAASLRNEPPDRYVFNFRASYAEEAATATRYLVEVRGFKPSQIAFVGQEDAFGDSVWKGFSKTMRQLGYDPRRTVRAGFKRSSDRVDVETAVRTLRKKSGQVQAVVMAAGYAAAAAFISKTCDLGFKYSNTSAGQTLELADLLMQTSPQCAENVMVTQATPLPSSGGSLVLRYREDLRRYAPAERPDFLSLQGYITAQIFIEGLRRAGPNLDTEKMVEALESIRGWDIGLGSPIQFTPSEHQASHRVWLATLARDGSIKPLDRDLP